ncbi:MAG: hypothetical protein AAGD40_00710 [Pseudomonadota bacterium]
MPVPLTTAGGPVALEIERLGGKKLAETRDGLTLVDRLAAAEPLIAAIEDVMGMTFEPSTETTETFAATLRVSRLSADGRPVDTVRIGLPAELLHKLSDLSDIARPLARTLPVKADIVISLPPGAEDARPGDVVLVGEGGGRVDAPAPLTTFPATISLAGTVAATADAPVDARPCFQLSGQSHALLALEAAKRGETLDIPGLPSGTVVMPNGTRIPASPMLVGETLAIRIDGPSEGNN